MTRSFRTQQWLPRQRRMLRRIMAALAMLCVALSRVEALIPDVHDGDAPASAVRLSDGPQAALAAEQRGEVCVASDDAGHHSGVPRSPDSDAPHSMHVDHCGHGHAVAPPSLRFIADVPRTGSQQPDMAAGKGPSVAIAPHLRPPIA